MTEQISDLDIFQVLGAISILFSMIFAGLSTFSLEPGNKTPFIGLLGVFGGLMLLYYKEIVNYILVKNLVIPSLISLAILLFLMTLIIFFAGSSRRA